MIVGVVVAAVFLLIVVGSWVAARRNTPPALHEPDVETERARVYYQGNGNTGLGGGGTF